MDVSQGSTRDDLKRAEVDPIYLDAPYYLYHEDGAPRAVHSRNGAGDQFNTASTGSASGLTWTGLRFLNAALGAAPES